MSPHAGLRRLLGASLVAGLLLSGGVATVASASADPPDTTTYAFAPTTATIWNPDRGLYGTGPQFTEFTAFSADRAVQDGFSLFHGDNDLSAFLSGPISDAWLAQFDTALGVVRRAHLKVILHFAYSSTVAGGVATACDRDQPPPEDTPPDAPLSMIAAHLAQLRPHLEANLDVISSVDAGFAGEWGEWHCSTNMLLSDTNLPLLFETLYSGFPEGLQINFRYPQDIQDELTAHPEYTARSANYQACYASGDSTDEGTWRGSPSQQADLKEWLGAVVGSAAFVSLTVCQTPSSAIPDRLTCDVAVGPDGRSGEFLLMHVSTFNGVFDASRFTPAYAPCWSDIVNRLGYRLQLDTVTLPSVIHPGDDIAVSLTLDNEGFASVIAPRPVYLVFDGAGGRETVLLDADPRSWAGMQSSTVSETLHVPDGLAAGSYRLSLWLPDASASLQSQALYSIQLANDGVWDAAAGDNTLVDALTITPAALEGSSPASTPGASSPAVLPATGTASSPWELIGVAAAAIALGLLVGVGGRSLRRRRT